ncbi:MAG: TetR/AcrR family transcriptional regulator [Pseudomonadota bacterium]
MKPNKANILMAASELFLAGGTGALSVRAIAKGAGVSTIGIYSHFDGKQGILDALYIEGFQAVNDAMDVLSKTSDPEEAARLAAKNYLDFSVKKEAHYRLIFGELDDSYHPCAEAQSIGVAAFEQFTKVAANLLPPDRSKSEAENVALQFWSLLHGSVSLRQHTVAELVSMKRWRSRTMIAVDYLLKGVRSEYV